MFAQYRAFLKCNPTRYSRQRVAGCYLAAKPEQHKPIKKDRRMNAETIDATIATAAAKVTYASASVGVFGWLFSNEMLGFFGVLIAFIGGFINWYYKAKQDRRDARHERRNEREHNRLMSLRDSSFIAEAEDND